MRKKLVNMNSVSIFLALLGATGACIAAIYHAMRALIKGILAISGLFKGVKKAHTRIDGLEIKMGELSNIMAPQIAAIYTHLMGDGTQK